MSDELNNELQRLIEHYGLSCLIEVDQIEAAFDLADFCFKHFAALRIEYSPVLGEDAPPMSVKCLNCGKWFAGWLEDCPNCQEAL